jgi:rhodanese-related sulfurtransferase
MFEELGFRNIVHLEEGYGGWVNAGHPIEK